MDSTERLIASLRVDPTLDAYSVLQPLELLLERIQALEEDASRLSERAK